MRLAISTGGGDAPGLNAVIRAAVLTALSRNWEVLGIKRGFAGLMGDDDVVSLTRESVRGIAHLGGTILRTTNRGNPFKWPRQKADGTFEEIDRSDELISNARQMGIDAFITIGGDGSLAIADRLSEKGLKIVGVPKTIDNDVAGTVTTFGFDTAVNTALEAIDRLHTTAESHDRVIVIEVMGRHAGFIALHAGLAGTADVILIPEIPYDLARVCAQDQSPGQSRAALLDRRRRGGLRPERGERVDARSVVAGTGPSRRWNRGTDRVSATGDDGQGNAVPGARAPSARWPAHRVRPPARHPVRRSGRPRRGR